MHALAKAVTDGETGRSNRKYGLPAIPTGLNHSAQGWPPTPTLVLFLGVDSRAVELTSLRDIAAVRLPSYTAAGSAAHFEREKTMKFGFTALLLAGAALLVGCIPTLHPLYTEQDLAFDPGLVGRWAEPNSKVKSLFFFRELSNVEPSSSVPT